MSKPILIVLNGPLAIGKSTLAKKIAANNPMTYRLDIDELRINFGSWRDYRKESGNLSWSLGMQVASTALSAGHDVVCPQIIKLDSQIQLLESTTKQTGASLCEIMLTTGKDDAIARYIERGKANGWPMGYNPKGLIGRSGGIKHVEDMYDDMQTLASTRVNFHTIKSVTNDVAGTYEKIMEIVEKHRSST